MNMPIWAIYTFIFFFTIFCIREIIKIFTDFKLKKITSNLSLEQNIAILKDSFHELDVWELYLHKDEFEKRGIIFQEFSCKGKCGSTHHFYTFVTKERIYLCGFNDGYRGYYSGIGSQKQLRQIIDRINKKISAKNS